MPEYSSQTGQVKKVTLPSSIEQVMWSKKIAAAGGLVDLDIFTLYIGNNSEIQIELSDGSGKAHGKYTERMAGNRFRVSIRVPSEAREELYATVKFPKHGLQQKSPRLLVAPAVHVSKAAWSKQEAKLGEIIKLIADVKGVPDGIEAVVHIYEFAVDGAHELLTKFPVHVKAQKVEAEWEHAVLQAAKGAKYFFRVAVAGVTGDSGFLESKE
jgi:hypothetical protein